MNNEFKKTLRQNSTRFYTAVIERANHRCEICGWGDTTLNCLQIHHINPIKQYYKDFYKMEVIPSKNYELANLVALCPNCHAFIHLFYRMALIIVKNGKYGNQSLLYALTANMQHLLNLQAIDQQILNMVMMKFKMWIIRITANIVIQHGKN